MNSSAENPQGTSLAVVILTYNEELHLRRAIGSIAAIADEIFVIDSFSTDSTVEIARSNGATVLQNTFVSQSRQFQWAMDNASIRSNWIMRLDADEVIEADLAKEIGEKLPTLPKQIVGINLKRKHIFLDRWIRHGTRYPLILLRIWRKGHGRIENRWMDEHIIIRDGDTTTFDHNFADHNLNDLSFFTQKHNGYATREAVDVLGRRFELFEFDELRSNEQASLKRWIKEHLYYRIPFPISALLYFMYRYFVRFGFLDGLEGLIYHFLQGFWYRFLIGAKIYELQRQISHLGSKAEMKAQLQRMTGLKLE